MIFIILFLVLSIVLLGLFFTDDYKPLGFLSFIPMLIILLLGLEMDKKDYYFEQFYSQYRVFQNINLETINDPYVKNQVVIKINELNNQLIKYQNNYNSFNMCIFTSEKFIHLKPIEIKW